MGRLVVLPVAVVGTMLLSTAAVAQPSNDERQLRGIQQQLARAWSQKDRAFIESVLAPEWSVTQPDGQVLTRATVLGTFFDAVTFDSIAIDDVSVKLFGDTAVVRGRTVAAGTFNRSPISARIRFTDVFIKRHGRWQAVASHASPLAEHPFVGNWMADLSKSKPAQNYQLQSATLQFAVAGDIVTVTSVTVLASGQEAHTTERFQTDGKAHPFFQGRDFRLTDLDGDQMCIGRRTRA